MPFEYVADPKIISVIPHSTILRFVSVQKTAHFALYFGLQRNLNLQNEKTCSLNTVLNALNILTVKF